MSDTLTNIDSAFNACMYRGHCRRIQRSLEKLQIELAQAKAELATLRAECERLKEDAERYRWLCDEAYIWGDSKIYGEDVQIEPAALWILGSSDLTKPQIDAAIDKGRKDQP